jgi:hypothetical protein
MATIAVEGSEHIHALLCLTLSTMFLCKGILPQALKERVAKVFEG